MYPCQVTLWLPGLPSQSTKEPTCITVPGLDCWEGVLYTWTLPGHLRLPYNIVGRLPLKLAIAQRAPLPL